MLGRQGIVSDRLRAPETLSPDDAGAAGDSILVRRIVDGDERAYAMLVERYLQPAYRFALRMLGRSADAEDAVQEGFIRLWNKAGQWRADRGSFRSWFYRLLYNLCVDMLRRRPPFDPELAIDPPSDDDPSAGLADRAREQVITAALARLPERQRAALLLTYYEGMSNREAAEALKVGVKALEALLVRGRRTLARDLGDLRDDLLGVD